MQHISKLLSERQCASVRTSSQASIFAMHEKGSSEWARFDVMHEGRKTLYPRILTRIAR